MVGRYKLRLTPGPIPDVPGTQSEGFPFGGRGELGGLSLIHI